MRSAYEALSFVLEPIRKELEREFASKDINELFMIINEFDVRHNKSRIRNEHHPEILEWVFYSLLNTISAYSKIKSKGETP